MPEYLYQNRCTNVDISHISYESISYENKETGKLVRGLDGAPIRRSVKLTNRLISFSYAIPTRYVSNANKLIGTINQNALSIGGLVFNAKEVKLLSFATEDILSKVRNPYTGVDVTVEIGDQKSVYETEIILEGFMFKHPKNGNMVKIQYSSEPDVYLRNKELYPNAVNVWKGFGFYTETRPDLNILEPFPLLEDGSLNTSDVGHKIRTVDALVSDWNILSIPRKGLI